MKTGANAGDHLTKMVANLYFWIGFMVNNYHTRNETLSVYLTGFSKRNLRLLKRLKLRACGFQKGTPTLQITPPIIFKKGSCCYADHLYIVHTCISLSEICAVCNWLQRFVLCTTAFLVTLFITMSCIFYQKNLWKVFPV